MRQSVLASVLEIAASDLHTPTTYGKLLEIGFAYLPARSASKGDILPTEPRTWRS